jgi:2-polyprenyl-6-methoxyphenol hydroxylase-like FAD-dependent oxidoreductase
MRAPVAEMPKRYGSGMMVVHRGQLHAALLAAVANRSIRLGAEVTGFSDEADGVAVTLAGDQVVEGNFLVGADGLRSAVRKVLIGDGEPTYQGFTAWRGEIPAGKLELDAGTGRNWWGRGGEFLAFPLTDGRVYWEGTANVPASASPGPRGHKHDVLTRFQGWESSVREIISATDEEAIIRTDIFDRDPVRCWSRGRVTLVGDAAHPMTPSQGQGACQALEDAVALAVSLARFEAPQRAFADYERRRLGLANRVVRLSRLASRSVQSENPFTRALRNSLVNMMPKGLILTMLDMNYGRPAA